MRIILIQNLMSQPPVPKAHAFYAGKPTRWAPYLMHAIVKEHMQRSIVDLMAAQERKRRITERYLDNLAEARRRQEIIQQNLWTTFLSEI